jgi:outer membrane protein OmpA-like peptidoglycan-associated protein
VARAKPEPEPEPEPEPGGADRDDDGIPNAQDKCPDAAEDLDNIQDEDGCPEDDGDDDGVPDEVDKCPTVPEDKDGYQDEDGCPDLDNDGDGIPDAEDKCPNEPEDMDGYEDSDGCDDPDNDKDGVPDVIDQCAIEPETINGNADDDGCPDEGESLVMLMPARIEVFESVRFRGRTARIEKKSENVLAQVGATLRANRDILKLGVYVYVQPRGANDKALSKERAIAVRDWLVKWGVEPERLVPKGFGSKVLLVPKNSKGAAKINDRVEFTILEKRIGGK